MEYDPIKDKDLIEDINAKDFGRAEDYPCDFACDWVAPYGFVPEAGCPIHDKLQALPKE